MFVKMLAQKAFWLDVRDMSGPQAIVKAQQTLEEYEEHEKSYEQGGKFLPLDVWAAKGFDSAAKWEHAPQQIGILLQDGNIHKQILKLNDVL